jgi:hypothetical protein
MKNLKIEIIERFALIFAIIMLLSTTFTKCENEKKQKNNIESLNSELQSYKLKNGKLAWSNETLNYTNSQLKEFVIAKDKKLQELTKKFSKVKSVTKEITTTKIDSIIIRYKDTIPCIFTKSGSIDEKWYQLKYNINQKELSINDIMIPDSVIVVTGEKRKWLFGKTTNTIDVSHSNPYMKVEGIKHIEVVEDKKWHETTLFKFGLGFIFGAILIK